jgi:nucleotide-binding universal stress UspA family protein
MCRRRSSGKGSLAQPALLANLVATLLAQHAAEADASLIVMTTHGHGGPRGLAA